MQNIVAALIKALSELGVQDPNPSLEFPAQFEHGDFATNAALAYGKELGKNPRALAEEIVSKLGDIDGVSKIEVAGPGFINFHLAPEAISTVIENTIENPGEWGRGTVYAGRKVMVEYTDPNPFKAFHIGHLMSNAIGESISRLIENAGATVIRANYQGDVGLHVARALWGKMQKPELSWGEAYAHGAREYENHKEEIEDVNKKIYKKDASVSALYEEGLKESLNEFERIYKTLGTKFDEYFFESETGPVGKEIVEAHADMFPESDGARVFRGEEHGLHTRVFLNSQGLPTYEAKELGLAKIKSEKYPDTHSFIVVTGNEIIEYFKVVHKAMECVLPEFAKKLLHIPHGMMRLASGKMSSRTGEVITGESLLDDLIAAAQARAKESRAEDADALARKVAVAAVKYQILKQAIGRDSIFDKERALSLEGDSGPYLQYAHARARALIEKGKEAGVAPRVGASAAADLERMLIRFPYVADRAVLEYAPQYVTTYLTELAGNFNSWYAKEQILDGTDAASHKLAVAAAVAETLKNGLNLLGVDTPDKM